MHRGQTGSAWTGGCSSSDTVHTRLRQVHQRQLTMHVNAASYSLGEITPWSIICDANGEAGGRWLAGNKPV